MNTLIKHTRPDQSLRPPTGTVLMVVGFCLVFMGAILETTGQEDVRAFITNQTGGDCANASPMTNEVSKTMLLSQHLGGPVSEVLLRNQFVLGENGILRRERIAVGDLKRLLKYEDWNLEQLPGTSAFLPAYFLPFTDARCIVEVAEERKSIRADATLVNVMINTNVIAVGRTLAPKRASPHMGKSSGDGEKK